MVDINEILAAAIRTVWLQVDGPGPRSHHHVEVETARIIRAALEGEGIIITEACPRSEAAAPNEAAGRKDAAELTESDGDKIVDHEQVRCLKQKQTEAPLIENWGVVSFWLKLFAISGLLMTLFAGLMMARIFRSFQYNSLRNARR